jgi:hypothetical protein
LAAVNIITPDLLGMPEITRGKTASFAHSSLRRRDAHTDGGRAEITRVANGSGALCRVVRVRISSSKLAHGIRHAVKLEHDLLWENAVELIFD